MSNEQLPPPNFNRIYWRRQYIEEILIVADYNRIHKYGSSRPEYEARMNLADEFAPFPYGAIVWDVACGTGEAACQMADHYPNLRFLAINHHKLSRPGNIPMNIPFIGGVMEELAGRVGERIKETGLYPADVIIVSNGLQYPSRMKTLDWAFQAIYDVLPSTKKVLIYEDHGDTLYPEYIDTVSRLGLNFQIEQLPGQGFCGSYLKLTKY